MGSISASARSHTERRPFWKSPLLGILFEQRYAWSSVLLFSFIINTLMLAPSIYMMQIFDRVMGSRNLTTLFALSFIALAFFAASGALEWARTRIMVRIAIRFDRTLGEKLYEASHRMGLERNGGAGSRLLGDLSSIRSFISGPAVLGALDVPWVPIFFLATMLLHPTLALLMLLGAFAMVLLTLATERGIKGPLARANECGAEAMRFAAGNVRNAEVIESMGMFRPMALRWQSSQDEYLKAQAMASDRAGFTSALSKFVRTINQNATIAIGAFLALSGELPISVIFAASLLTARMTGPIEQLTASWSSWGNAKDAWDRIDEALSLPEKTYSGIKLPAPKGELVMDGVFGGPPHVETPFLQNVSLTIPAGSSVAIIGSSASGKSTLLRLVAGVWAPRVGTVRIDGSDIRHWRREELGPHIGYLPQDVELIEGTIAENIARHGELDSEKVLSAAQAAGVHDMILHMPGGYSTQVGIGGAYLSGGQRQRIALARALYGDPALLILDEPNANLDEIGEIALDTALTKAKAKGQTVMLVSHRPIAIRNCDLVMVLQAGKISLYGPREQVFSVLANAAKASGKAVANPPAGADKGTVSTQQVESSKSAEVRETA